MARRGSPASPALGVVLITLVVGAGLLLWMALAVADFREPVAGSGAAGSGDGGPPSADEPAPSGWAPPQRTTLEPGLLPVPASTAAALAPAVLADVVTRAPVVVTVDQPTGLRMDAARDLADDLGAPLLVVSDDPGTAGSTATPATPAASPSPEATDDSTPDAGATTTPSGDDSTSTQSSADLLVDWAPGHVVAVGAPPETTATVHQVVVEEPTEQATTTPSTSPDATSTEVAAVVTRPEAVDVMLADAAANPDLLAVPEQDAAAVVRGGQDLPPELAQALTFAGLEAVAFDGDDPRTEPDLQAQLQAVETTMLAVADDQWPAGPPMSTGTPDWTSLFDVAINAPELVGGGKVLFPQRTLIATYGNPRGAALGVLGERELADSIAYTEELTSEYEGLFGDSTVQPAFDLIASVASSVPEDDETYSRKEDLDLLTEWVDGANEAGLYVFLDLQPGREDFLTQAKRLEDLLRRPNVGLALDPEWRLGPDEVHLEQIGTVTTAEVNEVSAWLAELVRDEVLPQKLLVIHNFRLSMLTEREDLDFPAELATLLHVDGQGAQNVKDDTYEVLTQAGPEELWWGWKNFFDEDSPEIRSPEDTAAIEPVPHVITYQ